MGKERPIFERLENVRRFYREFFISIHGWKLSEIENLSEEKYEHLQSQTFRLVYACIDVLSKINPGVEVTLSINKRPQDKRKAQRGAWYIPGSEEAREQRAEQLRGDIR